MVFDVHKDLYFLRSGADNEYDDSEEWMKRKRAYIHYNIKVELSKFIPPYKTKLNDQQIKSINRFKEMGNNVESNLIIIRPKRKSEKEETVIFVGNTTSETKFERNDWENKDTSKRFSHGNYVDIKGIMVENSWTELKEKLELRLKDGFNVHFTCYKLDMALLMYPDKNYLENYFKT